MKFCLTLSFIQPDLLCEIAQTAEAHGWDAVSVEIKAVSRRLNLSEWVQIRDYMKCRGESLGLLVNFGLDRVHVERVTHTPRSLSRWKLA